LSDRIAKEVGSLKRNTKGRCYSSQNMLCPPCSPRPIRVQPTREREQAHETGVKENSEGWFITPEGRILIPEKTPPRPGKAGHTTSPIWAEPPYKDYYTNIWSFLDWRLYPIQPARLACTVPNITQDRDPSPRCSLRRRGLPIPTLRDGLH
jgi:hypothetical protein